VEAVLINENLCMTYEYYHNVKRGKTLKDAPNYVRETEYLSKKGKYRCTICGYIYDPELGDPDGDISKGTEFEELPDDWVCPVCGAQKIEFEPI